MPGRPPRTDRAHELRACARRLTSVAERGAAQLFYTGLQGPLEPLTGAELRRQWEQQAAAIRAGQVPERLSLYVHIPFCLHKCRYCIYYSHGDSPPAVLAAYLKRLHAEIDHLAPALGGLPFVSRYLGGGTPTVLDETQLAHLLDHLAEAFPVRPGGERCFECSPSTVSEAKARLFERHGFNRVSFGVQTIDPGALSAVGRGYQTLAQVEETLRLMHACRFNVNVDLLHPLPGESPGALEASLAWLLAREPDQVTVYALSPFTPGPLRPARPVPPPELLEKIAPGAEAAGYRVKLHPTCVSLGRGDPPDGAVGAENRMTEEKLAHPDYQFYDDVSSEPTSLLALGPSAFGSLWGRLAYRFDPYPPGAPFDPRTPFARGRRKTVDEERRRFVTVQLASQGGLREEAFERLFGQKLSAVFPDELAVVRRHRWLTGRDGCWRHARRSATARLATEMLFVDEKLRDEVIASLPREFGGSAAPAAPATDGAPTSEEFGLVLSGPGLALRLIVAPYWPARPCLHHGGGLAIYIPSASPAGTCRHSKREERLLATFRRLFDRVLAADRPGTPAELVAALLRRGPRLRLRLRHGGRLREIPIRLDRA